MEQGQGHSTYLLWVPTISPSYQLFPILLQGFSVLTCQLLTTDFCLLDLTVPAGPGIGLGYLSMTPAELCEVSPPPCEEEPL